MNNLEPWHIAECMGVLLNPASMGFSSLILLWEKPLLAANLSGVSLKIGVAGEYWKVRGELLWRDKALSGNKQNLAGELSNLQCLTNTLPLECAGLRILLDQITKSKGSLIICP